MPNMCDGLNFESQDSVIDEKNVFIDMSTSLTAIKNRRYRTVKFVRIAKIYVMA